MSSPIVLINTFEVSAGMESEFMEWWERSSAVLKREPGFIDARLHRSLKSSSRFQFVNVAHWETEESLNVARVKNKEVLQSLTVGRGIPATYVVALEHESLPYVSGNATYDGRVSGVIVCPDCQKECQVTGRMGDSVYGWCQCNRYIQVYDQACA